MSAGNYDLRRPIAFFGLVTDTHDEKFEFHPRAVPLVGTLLVTWHDRISLTQINKYSWSVAEGFELA